ncbi:BON domain-containing protein [Thioalkalicoccus limnaeus]|uniref:BON domain-containing protein n=1 Tax=Thioalkalicoccus limnaeus TaxID=120681 RepID=A0ABV4BCN1_9GAMM
MSNNLVHAQPTIGRYPGLALILALGLTMPIGGLVSGCGPMLVGGTVAGASLLHDRRPAGVVVEDRRIELMASDRHRKEPEIAQNSRIMATSYNQVVLLTGQAARRDIRDRYADMVSRLPGVVKVVDQVTIGPNATLQRQGEDALLASRVRLALASVDRPDFDLTRVKVITESGTVHLMGLLTPDEEQAVIERVRHVPGVVQVVRLFEPYRPNRA